MDTISRRFRHSALYPNAVRNNILDKIYLKLPSPTSGGRVGDEGRSDTNNDTKCPNCRQVVRISHILSTQSLNHPHPSPLPLAGEGTKTNLI